MVSTSIRIKPMKKIVLIGSSGSGKTTWLRTMSSGTYVDFQCMTVGIDVASIGHDLSVWDVTGSKRWEMYSKLCMVGANAVIIFFDSLLPSSRDAVGSYIMQVRAILPTVPIAVWAAKCDDGTNHVGTNPAWWHDHDCIYAEISTKYNTYGSLLETLYALLQPRASTLMEFVRRHIHDNMELYRTSLT